MKPVIFTEDYEVYIFLESKSREGVFSRKEKVSRHDRAYHRIEKDYIKQLKDESKDSSNPEKQNKAIEKLKKYSTGSHIKVPERLLYQNNDYKCLYRKGQSFIPRKGLNVLVGENGCGKSTLINLFIEQNGTIFSAKEERNSRIMEVEYNPNIIFIDFERSNPIHTRDGNPFNHKEFLGNAIVKLTSQDESHGESRKGVLEEILEINKSVYEILILDEPEQGMSLKNQYRYINRFKELGKEKDIILVTHSKVMIENVDMVFDVESMEWVDSKEYLDNLSI